MTNKEAMALDYKSVKLIFQQLGARFFSIKGTCLGAIRNSDFIDWDTDIDQAVFMTGEKEVLMQGLLAKEGFDWEWQNGCTVAIRNTKVNIYRVLKDEKGFYINTIPTYCFKEGKLNTLVVAKLGDQFCFTQSQPVEYLVEQYGEKWATPIPK